ncbi:MAG TPA: hypothetical protein VKH81_02075 [Candidatus Angelobacter sp.]|nr:hypothetical protein [Candidatus Angelobacter sp.]
MKAAQSFIGKHRNTTAVIFLGALAMVCVVALSARAQRTRMSPYQGENDGVNVGGNWYAFRSENKMTAAKIVRFELQADNYLSWSRDNKPRVELVCTNRKYTNADFSPGAPLGPPNRPGFWGQPQIEVMVRADDVHHTNGWNWIDGRSLSMDKGTTRELIGAHIFKVQLPGPRGPEIAEFSPAGLDLDQVKRACDLTPKKTSKD